MLGLHLLRSRIMRRLRRVALAMAILGSCGWQAMAAEPQLPLPTHPGRQEHSPAKSLPKAAQPTRHVSLQSGSPFRSPTDLPVPGNPSRFLTPPGEEEGEAEMEEEAEEAAPGLTNFLPHEKGGITAEYIYTGEVFSNARGGLDTNGATSYRGNFDLVLNFDTAGMGLWEGGRFFLYGQNTHGRPLSDNYVGDFQYFSNIDSSPRPDLTQVSEFWYQHNMLCDQLWIKVGKQDANADFGYVDLGGDFINSSFGLIPNIPLPTFPNPGLGLATFGKLTENIVLAGGVYDGAPHGGQAGFATLGDSGYISLVQLEVKSQWGFEDQLPQTVRIGGWHHSGDWEEITTDPAPRTFNQNYGFWSSIDQLLWKESDEEGDEQGLGIFGQFGWAPGNRNVVQEYYGAGVTYRGLFLCRDQDLIGLGVANARFGSGQFAVEGWTEETATELFYKWYVNDYMTVQPDIQYIANPSGIHRDAVVPGMRFEVVF